MSDEKYELQNVSHRHEAIMLWLIANPTKTMSECAEHFGYTKSWLSTLVHSDVFQAKFSELRDQYNGTALLSLQEKCEAAAHIALDKLIEQLPDIEEPGFLLKTTESTLSKLGYGTNRGGVSVNVTPGAGGTTVQVIDGDLIEQARAKRAALQEQKREEKEINALPSGGDDAKT